MYPVSEAFLRAVQENTRNYYWTGKITTKSGMVHKFTNKDIVKGSGYISSQCCGSTEIELGTVYSSEMGITIFSEIDRYTLEDGLIELFYHLRLLDEKYEEVPMGVFEIISLCCKACGVEFAHTQNESESMQNGSTELSIYAENDIETYRDVLFYIGQILGGFFFINRSGKLELKKYGTEAVMEISNKQRFSSSFSDFITRYTAVSSTNLKTQEAEYYALETDDGLTMNLGANLFLQFGTDDARKELCNNILNDLSVIKYVPFDSETIGNPALDVGDVLRFSGGHADGEQITCITSSNCRIGGKHSLKCVGKNPRLASAKSKNDKNISGLLNQVEAGKIGIHTFTNASAYTLGETDTKVVSIEFATTEENHAQFFGQIVVDANLVDFPKQGQSSKRLTYRDKYSEYGFSLQRQKEFQEKNGFQAKRFYFLNFYPALQEYVHRLFAFGKLPFDINDASKKEPDYLDRTWLMHGRCCREVTRMDCVQLINVLDVCEFMFNKPEERKEFELICV